MQTTPNFAFKKRELTDSPPDITLTNSNWDTLDVELKPTADPSKAPTGLTGKIGDWVNWFTNRIKAITGKPNWYDAPSKSLEDLNTHLADFTQQIPYAVSTGSANTYAVSTTPALPALVAGVAITVKFHATNTGASTLNWNGKGAKSIKNPDGTDVASGDLNGVFTLRYDGVNFILQGKGGVKLTGNATPDKVFLGYTFYSNDPKTKQTGTFPALSVGTSTIFVGGGWSFRNEGNNNWQKTRVVSPKFGAKYRITMEVTRPAYGTAYARIYKNGVAYGTERAMTNDGGIGSAKQSYTEDLTFEAGDTIEIWGRALDDYNCYFTLDAYSIKVATNPLFDTII